MFGIEFNFKEKAIRFYNSKNGITVSIKSKNQLPLFMLIKEYYLYNKKSGTYEMDFAKVLWQI